MTFYIQVVSTRILKTFDNTICVGTKVRDIFAKLKYKILTL